MEIDISKNNDNGWTPLHFAVMKRDYDMAVKLIAEGANRNLFDKQNFTPLHLAVETGRGSEFIDLLATPENINAKTSQGFYESTPLLLALNLSSHTEEKKCVMKETVNRLIQHSADVKIDDNGGNLPLHCAAMFCSDTETIKLLITDNIINKVNKRGYTALARACNPPVNVEVDKKIIDFLVKAGARP
jgi:ankyrin repeat protein